MVKTVLSKQLEHSGAYPELSPQELLLQAWITAQNPVSVSGEQAECKQRGFMCCTSAVSAF